MHRIAFSFVLVLLLSVSVPAQVASQTPAEGTPGKPFRDPRALATIQAALTALGGATAVGQPQSWQIQGQVQATDATGNSVSGTITWEMAGSEFNMSATTTKGTQSIVTGHGNPAAVNANGATKISAPLMRAEFVPALVGPMLLKEYQNPGYNIAFAGNATLGTETVTAVRTSTGVKGMNARVTQQTWYFDKTSGLPVRVEYNIPAMGNSYAFAIGAVDLANYQPVSGAMYPFQIIWSFGKRPTGTVTLQTVTLNAAIASSDFDPPVPVQ